MSDIFSFKRFGNFFVSDFKRCLANYGLSLLILSLTGLMAYLITIFVSLIFGFGYNVPGIAVRWVILAFAFGIMALTIPAKCYGYITNKRSGSAYTLLPVSSMEKLISMLLNTAIIIPAIFIIVYVSIDYVIFLLDPNVTFPLFATEIVDFISQVKFMTEGTEVESFTNPFAQIDDHVILMSTFLLGAICFKRAKVARTILVIIVVSSILGSIAGPIIYHSIDMTTLTEEQIALSVFNNVDKFVLIDIISDILILIALVWGLFYRIKTIKY